MESEGCIHAYPCTFGWTVVGHNGAHWGHQDRNHEIPSKHPRLQHRIASCHQPSVLPFAWPEFLRMTLDVLWEWILSEKPQKRNPERLRFLMFSATGCLNKPFEIPIDLSKLHPSQNEHINHNIQSYDIFCSNQLKSQQNSEALTPRMMTVGFDFQHCSKCRLLDKETVWGPTTSGDSRFSRCFRGRFAGGARDTNPSSSKVCSKSIICNALFKGFTAACSGVTVGGWNKKDWKGCED